MKKLLLTLAAVMAASVVYAQNLWTTPKIDSTWAQHTPPTASVDDNGNINIEINEYAGWQWGGQVKVEHNVDFEDGKYYQISMKFVADRNCGGITLKLDDDSGFLFEDQTINLTADDVYIYKKDAVAGLPGNHIMVLDFGWVGGGTKITVSDIQVVEVHTTNPVATASSGTAGLAIDKNTGTRWESEFNDDQWWMVNYQEPVEFNTVKIVWEGAYAKSFKIQGSNDGETFEDLAVITDQVLSGFPYTQCIELDETVSYQYVKFVGIERGTSYGYSFWEFETYVAEPDVISSLAINAASAICKVGDSVALTPEVKNQYGTPMDAEVTYSVTPEDAGTVTDGVYTAKAFGAAKITATCGELSKTIQIFNYKGENVALNKPVEVTVGGFDGTPGFIVNNGNEGDVWQGDPSDAQSGEIDMTCQFVIDLEGSYDLNLITIKFEGACSDAYTIEVSADNETWAPAYAFEGTLGIYPHTDYIYGEDLKNDAGVRYVRFTSTKNSTQWGMKIYEMMVFGTVAETVGIESVEADSNVGATYNIAGQKVAGNYRGIVIRDGKKIIVK